MKKILYSSIIIIASIIGSLFLVQYTVFKYIWFKKLISYSGVELYISLKNSKKTLKKTKKVILGDSAGNQLFKQNKFIGSNTVSLTCNQATTLIGHYILLDKFFINNSLEKGKVYLVYHPASFENDLDLKFTYHYLVKPFYNSENKKYFDNRSDSIVKTIPYFYFSQIPIVKMTEWSPRYNYRSVLDYNEFYLSETSLSYIQRINELCKKNNCQLVLMSPIINESYKDSEFYDKMKMQVDKYELSTIFEEYFKNMIFVNDSLFGDEIHLKDEYIQDIVRKTNINEQIMK